MQPTMRPWTDLWRVWPDVSRNIWDRYHRRHIKLSLQDIHNLQNIKWSSIIKPQITVYSPTQLRKLIGFDSSVGRPGQVVVYPTVVPGWIHDKYPYDPSMQWRLTDMMKNQEQMPPVVPPVMTSRSWHWENALRGWTAGITLLFILALIVKLAEKCLLKNLFKLTRRQSAEEWPTPHVLATRHISNREIEISHLEEGERIASESDFENICSDLPPPYSECADHDVLSADSHITPDDPPPPYSACYVAFKNRKDGIPTVHFYIQSRVENESNAHIDLEHGTTSDISDIENIRTANAEIRTDNNINITTRDGIV